MTGKTWQSAVGSWQGVTQNCPAFAVDQRSDGGRFGRFRRWLGDSGFDQIGVAAVFLGHFQQLIANGGVSNLTGQSFRLVGLEPVVGCVVHLAPQTSVKLEA
jgi:hypothetical protein